MKYYFLDANLQHQSKNRAEAAAENMIRLFNHMVIAEHDVEPLIARWSEAINDINSRNPRCADISYYKHKSWSDDGPVFSFADKFSVFFTLVVVDPPSLLNEHPLSYPELAARLDPQLDPLPID